MRALTLILLILCLGFNARAQNIVVNPSFEQHSQCPTAYSQISYCNSWYDGAWASTCDYYSALGCTGNFSPPSIHFGGPNYWYQKPLSGQSFAGFIPFYTNPSTYLEFIQGTFSSPLAINKVYYVEFYINSANLQKYFIHDISALITDTQVVIQPPTVQIWTPQILPQTNKIYDDTLKWMRINGYYTAHGGENFITIGNFTTYGQEIKDSTSDPNALAESYYFIDSVGVYEVTEWDAWNAGPDKTINAGDSTLIGNPSNDYSMFNWGTSTASTTYLSDSTNSWPYAKPTQTTTYYVTKTQGSTVFKDTVIVNINPNSIEAYAAGRANVQMFPNPSNGKITIKYSLAKDAELIITDIAGNTVAKYMLSAKAKTLDVENEKFDDGIYLYRVNSTDNFSKTGKIIIIK